MTESIFPIEMILYCPRCGDQHVDAADLTKGWDNPPHRSHLCHGCGWVWRPSDVPTTGVYAIETRGTNDGPHVVRAGEARVEEWKKRFDLFWKAQMRGVEAWRKANPGNDLVLPDMAKLTEWLVGQVAKRQAVLDDLAVRAGVKKDDLDLDEGMHQ